MSPRIYGRPIISCLSVRDHVSRGAREVEHREQSMKFAFAVDYLLNRLVLSWKHSRVIGACGVLRVPQLLATRSIVVLY